MSENIFGDIIQIRTQELCHARGWKPEDLAEKSGLSEDTIMNIWRGRSKNPQVSTVYLIAEAFGLTLNCFLGKCTHTVQEKELLRNYRACGKNGQSNISLVARKEASSAKFHDSKGKNLPPIQCVTPPGDISKGILFGSCETSEIPPCIPEAYMAIDVPTNDFSPDFCKGDTVLFEDRFPNNGEYFAFMKGDRLYIRKFIEENGYYILKCLHHYDTDIIIKHMDEISLVGTYCGRIRDRKKQGQE